MDNLSFQQEAKELKDEMIELAVLEEQKIVRPSAEQVKQAARELIIFTEELRIKSQLNLSYLENVKAGEDSSAAYKFSKKMVTQKEDFRELMRKVLNFQNLSNEFLGQKIQMTFVSISKKGEVVLYAVDNAIEDIALDKASSSHGGDIIGKYRESIIKREGQKIINSNYDSTSLNNTFINVYDRYKISKEKIKMKGAAFILWKDPDWEGVWISGAGPLGEAYVGFFINEYIFNSNREANIKNFMLNNKYGAVNVDNASGFLQGDVTKNGIEYGIKINSASALGYMEIIQYAKDLLEATDVEKFLLKLKKTLQEKGIHNMVKPIEGELKEKLNSSLIEALENKYFNLTN